MYKYLILIVFVLGGLNVFSQESTWTNEELELLAKYDLANDEHRGIRFSFDNEALSYWDLEAPTIKQGIEYFFMAGIKKDLLIIKVGQPRPLGMPSDILDIKGIVELYIQQK